ncbi:unnamed protein product [Adineta ricciae]|uniref:Pentraxin (PTX) domain-containing protein n=1 Tax=Adineta ricciae TaxID=249248 RepID=A0A814NKP7_ADIRI|nr:unnamed protein product [Adineta ricciae]
MPSTGPRSLKQPSVVRCRHPRSRRHRPSKYQSKRSVLQPIHIVRGTLNSSTEIIPIADEKSTNTSQYNSIRQEIPRSAQLSPFQPKTSSILHARKIADRKIHVDPLYFNSDLHSHVSSCNGSYAEKRDLLATVPASISSSTSTATVSSTTTTTATICNSSCVNQTWLSSSDLLAKWTFNGTFLDETATYSAMPVNSPSFISSGYVYQSLSLSAASSQFIYSPYIPLLNSSFTIEVWLYPTGYPNSIDHSILGLCTYPGSDYCLHITIRESNITHIHSLYMSFFGDTCETSVSVPLNTWTHAAFVFDINILEMSIYLDGYLIGAAISAIPLQGTTNPVTIGYIPGIVTTYGSNYYQGYMDQLTIVSRVKSECEILDDASLVTYYTFDNSPVYDDSGPNSLTSTYLATSFALAGHSGKAISFNDSTAYLQISGLTALGTNNKAFSISLWIRPYALSGTLVFVSSSPSGTGWCISMLGFAVNGSIVAQILSSSAESVFGPAVPVSSTWHHIVQIWSSTNGLQLYIDNVLVASRPSVITYSASSASNYVRLANRPNNACLYGGIGLQNAYSGEIDDFKIYSRELSKDDVCALYRS